MTTAQDKLLHCILWAYTFLLTLASTMSFLYVNNVARRLIVKFCDVYVRNWVTLRKGALKALWLVRYNRPMFSCANRSCFCRLSLFHCFKVLFDYYYKYYYICDCHCLLPSESIGSRYTLRFVCLQNLNKKKWKKISISRYHTVTFVMQVANNISDYVAPMWFVHWLTWHFLRDLVRGITVWTYAVATVPSEKQFFKNWHELHWENNKARHTLV